MFFKKFFGRKNDGFFLQLEDEDASSKPEAKAKAKAEAKPAAAPTPAPAATVVTAAPVAAPAPVVAPATTTAPAPAAKVDKKAAKVDKKAPKSAETPKVEAPKPVVTAPVEPPITNFATDYLIKPSSNSSRRLPGANMRGFLELARQVDKPKGFKNTAAERKPGK